MAQMVHEMEMQYLTCVRHFGKGLPTLSNLKLIIWYMALDSRSIVTLKAWRPAEEGRAPNVLWQGLKQVGLPVWHRTHLLLKTSSE